MFWNPIPPKQDGVDYGSEGDIFLLASIHRVTGEEAPITDTGDRCAEKLNRCRNCNDLNDQNMFNED